MEGGGGGGGGGGGVVRVKVRYFYVASFLGSCFAQSVRGCNTCNELFILIRKYTQEYASFSTYFQPAPALYHYVSARYAFRYGTALI
jgi:hypothetical protein